LKSNDEVRRLNDERITKPEAPCRESPLRLLRARFFGFPSSFEFRHSTFRSLLRFGLRFRRNRLIRPNTVLPLPRPPMRAATQRHQQLNGLYQLSQAIALPRPSANRTFPFAIVGITHGSSGSPGTPHSRGLMFSSVVAHCSRNARRRHCAVSTTSSFHSRNSGKSTPINVQAVINSS